MTTKNERACKDCVADYGGTIPKAKLRPATFPGPRCYSHHQVFKNRTRVSNHRRRTEGNFGLPPGGYDKLLEAQGGACGGCGVVPGPRAKRLAVDHDHTCCSGPTSCGRCVRGLLCFRCNDTLARYRDNGEMLLGLADYLVSWPSAKVEW